MLLSLLLIPILGIFFISSSITYELDNIKITQYYRNISIIASGINLILSFIIFGLFDFSKNEFQFVQEHYDMGLFNVYLGIDGISIYFVLLTTCIIPIALISSLNSITEN